MTVYFLRHPLDNEVSIKHSPLNLVEFNKLAPSEVLFAVEGDLNSLFCLQACFESLRVDDDVFSAEILTLATKEYCAELLKQVNESQLVYAPLPPYQQTLFVFWEPFLETRVMFWDVKSHRDLYLRNPKVVMLGSLKWITPPHQAYELQKEAIALGLIENQLYSDKEGLSQFNEYTTLRNPKALIMPFTRPKIQRLTLKDSRFKQVRTLSAV